MQPTGAEEKEKKKGLLRGELVKRKAVENLKISAKIAKHNQEVTPKEESPKLL